MRLWSIHPKYLDKQELGGVWREALLAKCVLKNKTKGYKNHSQLIRFKKAINPVDCINYYLSEIYIEAKKRGYKYNRTKIDRGFKKEIIPVTNKQLEYEFKHLLQKLKLRDINRYYIFLNTTKIEQHNMFAIVEGEIEEWERVPKCKRIR